MEAGWAGWATARAASVRVLAAMICCSREEREGGGGGGTRAKVAGQGGARGRSWRRRRGETSVLQIQVEEAIWMAHRQVQAQAADGGEWPLLPANLLHEMRDPIDMQNQHSSMDGLNMRS